ncbi:MAG: DUF3040 domain-containing protein [Sciscionella sp.]
MVELTAHERTQLAEIEHRLLADEQRLHRALLRMSTRPLRRRSNPTTTGGNTRVRLALLLTVWAAGLAALVIGLTWDLAAATVAGVLVAGFGPLVARGLLTLRSARRG